MKPTVLLSSNDVNSPEYYCIMSKLYVALFKGATEREFDAFYNSDEYEHPGLVSSPIGGMLAWGNRAKHEESIEVKLQYDLDDTKAYLMPYGYEIELPIV